LAKNIGISSRLADARGMPTTRIAVVLASFAGRNLNVLWRWHRGDATDALRRREFHMPRMLVVPGAAIDDGITFALAHCGVAVFFDGIILQHRNG